MAVVLVGGTVLFMLLGERLIPDFNHGVLLAILLVTTVLRALYMLNISTTKGYENFRATATISVIGAPLNLLLILLVWWTDGPLEWFPGTYTFSRLVFWWISRLQVAPLLPPQDSRAPPHTATPTPLPRYTALFAVPVLHPLLNHTTV